MVELGRIEFCAQRAAWIMWMRIASIEFAASLPLTNHPRPLLLDVTIQHSKHMNLKRREWNPSWYMRVSPLFYYGMSPLNSTSLHLPST